MLPRRLLLSILNIFLNIKIFKYVLTNSILKSRDITLPIKVRLLKAMVFPIVSMDVRVGL